MTPKQKTIKMLIWRGFILLLIAALLTWCFFFTMKDDIMLNFLTALASVILYIFILFKLRIPQMLFGRDREGTVTKVEVIALQSKSSRWGIQPGTKITVDFGGRRPKVYCVYADKIKPHIFRVGDRVKHFRGAKYPHNLTRKGEIFLCPFCARNLFEDHCPDCKVRF